MNNNRVTNEGTAQCIKDLQSKGSEDSRFNRDDYYRYQDCWTEQLGDYVRVYFRPIDKTNSFERFDTYETLTPEEFAAHFQASSKKVLKMATR